jgi:hypothetical protein
MHQKSDHQLSPTHVVKSLLNNGFHEFHFSDFLQEFKRHFPEQSAKSVYQSLYRVVERFVKKGYLVKHTQTDETVVFKQTDLFGNVGEQAQPNKRETADTSITNRLRDELNFAENELWVISSSADQCQRKMLAYPQMRTLLSKMYMEYKEESLSKLGEVAVLKRMLAESEKL